MSFNEYAEEIHRNAVEHGFWPEEGRNMGEMIALMHSELSEALEEHREGRPAVYSKVIHSPAVHLPFGVDIFYLRGEAYWDSEGQHPVDFESLERAGVVTLKPEGVAVELADCLIRILDTMQSLGVDIDEIVNMKMRYNESRAHKHGKAY